MLTLGGVIVGSGLDVDSNGVLSFEGGNFETTEHAAATYATITTVDGKANAQHTHNATDINNGTLAVARGGTGVTTAAAERERLGLGSTTGALPVANGGTGSTTAADARTALDVYSSGEIDTALAGKANSTHSHAAADITSGQVAIANGGTGASTADAARQALNASREWYATSSTAAATAAKTATSTGFVLEAGTAVNVRFAYENTAASPTLNVNSTGAKAIYANNSTTAANVKWMAGETVHFVYDGTYWRMANSVAINSLWESVSSYLTTARYSVTVNRTPGSSASITAPSVSGYSFVCWLGGSTNGWVSAVYVEYPDNANSKVWVAYNNYTNGTGAVNCFALYKKNA